MKVYGIKNCDTCRKALKWLEQEGAEFQFHDFRKEELDEETVDAWLAAVGSSTLINKRGTTYRQLDDQEKVELDGNSPSALLMASPTLIKRPVFEDKGRYVVGFKDAEKAALKNILSAD